MIIVIGFLIAALISAFIFFFCKDLFVEALGLTALFAIVVVAGLWVASSTIGWEAINRGSMIAIILPALAVVVCMIAWKIRKGHDAYVWDHIYDEYISFVVRMQEENAQMLALSSRDFPWDYEFRIYMRKNIPAHWKPNHDQLEAAYDVLRGTRPIQYSDPLHRFDPNTGQSEVFHVDRPKGAPGWQPEPIEASRTVESYVCQNGILIPLDQTNHNQKRRTRS